MISDKFKVSLLLLGLCIMMTAQVPVEKIAPVAKLNGNFLKPEYKNLKVYSNFVNLLDTKQKPEARTEFKIAHDGANIYIAVKAFEPEVDKLKTKVTKRDGKVWADDSITLMFDVNGDRLSYYNLIINPKGVFYDSLNEQGGVVHVPDYNANVTAATSIKKGYWTVEVKISVIDLAIGGDIKDKWTFNIGRERYGAKKEKATFSPIGDANFHRPESFSQAILKDFKLKNFAWEIKSTKIKIVPEGKSRVLTGTCSIINNTQSPRFFYRNFVLKKNGKVIQESKTKTFLYQKRGGHYNIKLPVDAAGNAKLYSQVINYDGEIMAQKISDLTLDYAPLNIVVDQPHYRNTIFATDNLTEIKGRIKVSLNLDNTAKGSVDVALKNNNGKIIESFKAAKLQKEIKFKFNAGNLPDGFYTIDAKINGIPNVSGISTTRIRKVAKTSGSEVKLDKNGVMLFNGKTIVPFGWTWSPAKKGVYGTINNMAMNDKVFGGAKTTLAKLDAYAKAGMKVIINPYPYPKVSACRGGKRKRYPLKPEEAKEIRNFIRQIKHHPNLMGYYIADEPECSDVSVDWLEPVYRILKEEDPYHPVFVTNMHINALSKYKNCADIYTPDPYPGFIKNSLASRQMDMVMNYMKVCREISHNKKSWWIIPQCFSFEHFNSPNGRAPNFSEVRNMFYQAVIGGARGFLPYAGAYTGADGGLRYGVPFVNRELILLKDAVIGKDVKGEVKLKKKIPDFYFNVREAKGDYFIFAVNCSVNKANAEFILNKNLAQKNWYIISEGSQAQVKNNKISQEFGTYGTYLFTTNKKIANSLKISETVKKIAEFERSKVRPGNIAFAGYGTKVSVSSAIWTDKSYINMNDGVRDGTNTWKASFKDKKPFLILTFPKTETVGKVDFYTGATNYCTVSGRQNSNSKWIELAKSKINIGKTSIKIPASKLKQLRLNFKERPNKCQEVEVYEK